jgi:hypothetical protein
MSFMCISAALFFGARPVANLLAPTIGYVAFVLASMMWVASLALAVVLVMDLVHGPTVLKKAGHLERRRL